MLGLWQGKEVCPIVSSPSVRFIYINMQGARNVNSKRYEGQTLWKSLVTSAEPCLSMAFEHQPPAFSLLRCSGFDLRKILMHEVLEILEGPCTEEEVRGTGAMRTVSRVFLPSRVHRGVVAGDETGP